MSNVKRIAYTQAGEDRLAKLHRAIGNQIEQALRERKFVPGDEQIEITGSDVDELARSMRVDFFSRFDQRRMFRRVVIGFYFLLGILTTIAGLFYHYFLDLIKNPTQLFLVGAGVLMSLGSFLLWTINERHLVHLLSTKRRLEEDKGNQETAS
jgi:hypothetical protein